MGKIYDWLWNISSGIGISPPSYGSGTPPIVIIGTGLVALICIGIAVLVYLLVII